MSNRIDLTQFEKISPAKEWGLVYPERPERTSVRTGDGLYSPHCRADDIEVRRANMALMAAGPDLLAELKRCYEREDALIEALKIVRDDLDDALETKGYNTLAHEKSEKTLQRIRNFANDASQ